MKNKSTAIDMMPGDKMTLLCKTAKSGVGLGVPVEVVQVKPRPKGLNKSMQEVEIILPDGGTTTVRVADLSGPHTRMVDCEWDPSSVDDGRSSCEGTGRIMVVIAE